jgi:hypothetical protein
VPGPAQPRERRQVAAFDALDHRLLVYWRDGEVVPDQA